MKGIVVASHGKMAEGILDSSKLFFGEQGQFIALCISGGESSDEFYELIKSGIEEVDSGDGVIFLCDILFGTPCNCAVRLMDECKDNLDIIAGVNLPMVLHILASRESGMLNIEEICRQGVEGINNIRTVLENEVEED